jgi:hypothetical protein
MLDPAGPELAWLNSTDTGLSSECIWRTMLGVPEPHKDFHRGRYPYDPADFGRCHRLLQRFPAWRERILEMAVHGTVWREYAARWSEMEALYEEEEPSGRAPKLYALMREIREGAAPQ